MKYCVGAPTTASVRSVVVVGGKKVIFITENWTCMNLRDSWRKGLFTRREDYPSKRVNPSCRAKDSPVLQAKFHWEGNPQPGTI